MTDELVRLTKWLKWLTVAVVFLTLALIALEFIPHGHTTTDRSATSRQSQ
jgi:hypothetical protein